MAWIKRNLFFVAGGVAALLLLGVAAFYLISNLNHDSAVTEELNQQISELRNIYNAPVHPGTETVDNISAAKKDRQHVAEFLGEARKLFVPIPTYPKTDDKGFNNLLLNTIYELQTSASNSGVALPPDYSFTFLAQRGKLTFATNSIEPWTVQLGEIKTICNILYKSRINALEGMRRVPVSVDDAAGTADYLPAGVTTNDVAIRTPYEVSFRSFSAELASVMNGVLRSTNCLIVKSVSVEPSTWVPGGPEGVPGSPFPIGYPPPTTIIPSSRYGLRTEGPRSFFPPPGALGAPGTPPTSTVPTVFLTEKPLHITLLIDVVKLKPQR
ncbi:MAG: hypothetical protein ABIQ35_12945 [Verrucomicrobiota bacterium]